MAASALLLTLAQNHWSMPSVPSSERPILSVVEPSVMWNPSSAMKKMKLDHWTAAPRAMSPSRRSNGTKENTTSPPTYVARVMPWRWKMTPYWGPDAMNITLPQSCVRSWYPDCTAIAASVSGVGQVVGSAIADHCTRYGKPVRSPTTNDWLITPGTLPIGAAAMTANAVPPIVISCSAVTPFAAQMQPPNSAMLH